MLIHQIPDGSKSRQQQRVCGNKHPAERRGRILLLIIARMEEQHPNSWGKEEQCAPRPCNVSHGVFFRFQCMENDNKTYKGNALVKDMLAQAQAEYIMQVPTGGFAFPT